MAVFYHSLEQPSHVHDSIHQIVQLRDFSSRKCVPALGGAGYIAKTKEEVPNLCEGEAELPCTLDDRQPIDCCRVVSSLSAHSLRAR